MKNAKPCKDGNRCIPDPIASGGAINAGALNGSGDQHFLVAAGFDQGRLGLDGILGLGRLWKTQANHATMAL